MKIKYSKPLTDVTPESQKRLSDSRKLFNQQQATAVQLKEMPFRSNCVLCGQNLAGEKFLHRQIEFIHCVVCGQVQTAKQPATDYPFAAHGFNKIYPQLSDQEFTDRQRRIYQPKLAWVVEFLQSNGYQEAALKNKTWLELGCGAGYFLTALKEWGATKTAGVDADKILVETANKNLNARTVELSSGDLATAIKQSPADIYVAWFVLEHLNATDNFLAALKTLPAGTIFVFSVPVFGLSCLIEGSAAPGFYARNLDGVVHTQLFTEASINYAMNLAGYDIIAEWIFGQDAEDLGRLVDNYLQQLPAALKNKFFNKSDELLNGWQETIDRLHLADQRHIVAVKK